MSRRKVKWREKQQVAQKFVGQTGIVQDMKKELGMAVVETSAKLPKLSDRIYDIADPYLDKYPDLMEQLIVMSIMAWNSCNMGAAAPVNPLEELRAAGQIDDADYRSMQGCFQEMQERKRRMFPDDKRMVVDYEFVQDGPNLRFNVASTIPGGSAAEKEA